MQIAFFGILSNSNHHKITSFLPFSYKRKHFFSASETVHQFNFFFVYLSIYNFHSHVNAEENENYSTFWFISSLHRFQEWAIDHLMYPVLITKILFRFLWCTWKTANFALFLFSGKIEFLTTKDKGRSKSKSTENQNLTA